MTRNGSSEDPRDPEHAARDGRIGELRRRIDALEADDEAAFGSFGAWDWLVCVLVGVAGPALAVWWFAG